MRQINGLIQHFFYKYFIFFIYLFKNNNLPQYKNSPHIKKISVSIEKEKKNEFSIFITDAEKERFSFSKREPFSYTKNKPNSFNFEKNYQIILQKKPFQLKVIRNNTIPNEIIFDTADNNFIFTDKYIEFTIELPSNLIYGLGERIREKFKLDFGIYTIYSKDYYGFDDGKNGGKQIYGVHPVFLIKEKSGNWDIIFLRNLYPMDIVFADRKLTYKIVKGTLDFKLILGDKYPETAIKKYHEYLNGYALMPFWSMGFHQCRWGYASSKELLQVAENYKKYKIPLDTIWSDIDYMNEYKTFTVDRKRFPKKEMDLLKQKYNLNYVAIMDLGVPYRETSKTFLNGKNKDVYIKSAKTGIELVNCVWMKQTVYPDFNKPSAEEFWQEEIAELSKKLGVSGWWHDMNEIAAFVDGELINPNEKCQEFRILESNPELPYVPGGKNLEHKTISLDAKHSKKGSFIDSDLEIREWEFHSVNAFGMVKNTYEAMKNKLGKKLPFILTRSNMPGTGRFSAHWSGDNFAKYDSMRASVVSIFNGNLFGIPFIGADICGFNFDADDELCALWMGLGAFYPFSR